jgi:hypothetical protein
MQIAKYNIKISKFESVCSASLEGKTNWTPHSNDVEAYERYAEIDISHCEFIEKPVITTSLGGLFIHL